MRSSLRCFVVILVLAACYVPFSWGADDALEAARREYAVHFFSVDAHVNLAKQQYEHGDKLQAFYTLEEARRAHFEQNEFTKSFRRIFLNDLFDNSPQAEADLRARLKDSPNDPETLKKLADVYISREEWNKAIPLLETKRKLHPEDFSAVAALAEVYQRMNKDEESKSLAAAWTKEHPDSLETYHLRIDEQLRSENPAVAGPLVEEALKKYPDDAALHFDFGIVLERSNDLVGTRKEFDRAVQLGPRIEHIQGWVARFYLMRKIDLHRALDLYLNAYFLDPDFYDSEYAEERIQKIAPQVAESFMDKDNAPPELLPAIEDLVLRSAHQKWDAGSAQKVLKIMGSDDETNRATAMMLLAEHKDANLDQQISALLDDGDVRKRGMAGYLAVKWRPDQALPVMKKWLDDPAELVRFDAISALIESGPAGRKIVQEYDASGKEPNSEIRAILSKALSATGDKKPR